MMTKPELILGYLRVFPNYRHQHRKDGFGCKTLSPKCLGPINHKQPGLPICQNLENFHQFNKVYPSELNDDAIKNHFYMRQRIAYNDFIPHRHKQVSTVNSQKELPVFSLFYSEEGKEFRYTYIQSRYLYCHYYEKLATKQKDFAKLQEMIASGNNIHIIGYDGFNVEPDPDCLYAAYLETKKTVWT